MPNSCSKKEKSAFRCHEQTPACLRSRQAGLSVGSYISFLSSSFTCTAEVYTNVVQGTGIRVSDEDLGNSGRTTHSAMETCWVTLGQSRSPILTYLKGCCEHKTEENDISSLDPQWVENWDINEGSNKCDIQLEYLNKLVSVCDPKQNPTLPQWCHPSHETDK